MPNESKKKTEKSKRLTNLDGLVLAMVRLHRPPSDALDYCECEREPAVEASLAKLERLGHIRRAAGYVATSRGPEAKPGAGGAWNSETLANEFCVPVAAVVGIVRRLGFEPGQGYVLHKAKAG